MHWTEKYKYHLKLPKGSLSPTGSIYKTHDIVEQKAVVNSTTSGGQLYCHEPFKVKVKYPSGRVKVLDSKINKVAAAAKVPEPVKTEPNYF